VGGEMKQPHVPGLPFDESADRGAVVRTDDEVTFPVPSDRSVCGFKATVVNGEHGLSESPSSADLTTKGPACG
jgi:hypothetical protein